MERDGGRRDSPAPPPPPPPPPLPSPPSSPLPRASPSSSSSLHAAAGVWPSPLDVAPHETTIGKYIARFRNDKPRPREARAAVSGHDFWWALSPRYKRRLQSPGSAASSSPGRSRASIFDFDAGDAEDKEADERNGRQDNENVANHSNTPHRHSEDHCGDQRRAGGVLYQSLDELERRVRQELGEAPSASPSLASSWSSSVVLMEELSAPTSSAGSATEDPEVVIERVRRRLGWRSASYSLRDVPPQPAVPSRTPDSVVDLPATLSGSLSSSSTSLASNSPYESESARSSRGLKLDLGSMVTSLPTPTGDAIDDGPSPTAASPLPHLALSSLGSPSEPSSAPSSSVEREVTAASSERCDRNDVAAEAAVALATRLESLSLQLDSAIGMPPPLPVTPPFSEPQSPSSADHKQTPDSRSQFTLSDDVPDLRLNGVESPDEHQPATSLAVRDDDERPVEVGPDDHIQESQQRDGSVLDVATPTTSVPELDDSLRTPRESTPPRATPPLPPTRLRPALVASRKGSVSPTDAKASEEKDGSPHSAAEQVLNTLVGFVVHSWSEDEQSDDDASNEKQSPARVVKVTTTSVSAGNSPASEKTASVRDEEHQQTTKSEEEKEKAECDVPAPASAISTTSSNASVSANAEQTGQSYTVVAPEAASEVDEDNPFDLAEDYAQENESDEMALLLVARIAAFKEALRCLQEREARGATT